jgi:hypothetical protein
MRFSRRLVSTRRRAKQACLWNVNACRTQRVGRSFGDGGIRIYDN